MKAIAELLQSLEKTADPAEQSEILRLFFTNAPDDDRVWALYFLSGSTPKKQMTSASLKALCAEASSIPLWLVDESYHAVGDIAETAALILPPPETTGKRPIAYWMQYLGRCADLEESQKRQRIITAWQELHSIERVFFNRILTGTLRPPVSRSLVCKALAAVAGVGPAVIARRIQNNWNPDDVTIKQIVAPEGPDDEVARPYPFHLADVLTGPADSLGNRTEWQAEWMWDGVRAQLIKRRGELLLWSKSEDLLTNIFPELTSLTQRIPDGTVLDGEIVARRDDVLLPPSALRTRIGRPRVSKGMLREIPIQFVVFDLLEAGGNDIRNRPLNIRREMLEQLHHPLGDSVVRLSPVIEFPTWDDLTQRKERARAFGAQGVMLKHRESTYQAGRQTGDWWKWRADPFSINAVLLYAERTGGYDSDTYSLFTFAVWYNGTLISCARTGAGVADADKLEVDAFIRTHTREKFGPVCTVTPALVFEIGFDGIEHSARRKSGVVLKHPRILRWHRGKAIESAGTLEELHAMLRE